LVETNTMGKKNPLIELIFNSEWSKALKCLQEDGSYARKWNITQSFTGDLRPTEILPIHQACAKNDVEVPFLESLIFAYPESVDKRESGARRSILHIALRARVSDEVISFLLEKNPDGVLIQDSLGRVPLHYAFSNHASKATIEKLIKTSPDTIRAADNMGWTPLHVACSLYHSAEIVEAMIQLCPEAVMMVTRKGTSTVTCSKTNPSRARDLIMAHLVNEEQKFLKMPAFQNFREAEIRHEKTTTCFSRRRSSRKVWGLRKRVRSNSVRRVV